MAFVDLARSVLHPLLQPQEAFLEEIGFEELAGLLRHPSRRMLDLVLE